MRNFWNAQRQALSLFWHESLSAELFQVGVVGAAILLFGFFSSLFMPQLSERLFQFFSNSLADAGILEQTGFALVWGILTNNLSAMFSTILWGVIPFLYLPAFSLGMNFFLIGSFGAYYMQHGISLLAYFAGILPHGILELPALAVACAAGLCLCRSITNRIRKKDGLSIPDTINGCVGLYWIVLLPLIIAAALLEVFVTPLVMSLFL